MNMQVIVGNCLFYLFAQQVIVNERFGCLTGKFHHHTCGGICVHICIFAGNVVRLDIDDFQEHIAGFCFTGNTALIAVGNVFLSHILAATVH